jgi:ribonuclease HI
MSTDGPATMNIDGGSRGNPGPAAYAVVLARPGLPPVEEADTLGTATNNVAEYTALVRGLELAGELGVRRLDVLSDSELLVKQMNGDYRVKHPDLIDLYREAVGLRKRFDRVTLTHVRREQNKRADFLCNEALDGRPRRPGEPPPPAPPPGAKAAKKSAAPVTDAAVRDDAIACLSAAANAWATHGLAAASPGQVWDQLWSILEEGGVLRKKK